MRDKRVMPGFPPKADKSPRSVMECDSVFLKWDFPRKNQNRTKNECPRGERNGNFRYGPWTRESIKTRQTMRAKIREIKALLKAATQSH